MKRAKIKTALATTRHYLSGEENARMATERIVAKQPEVIGGDYATTVLSEDHQGPVSMRVSGREGRHIIEATFPTLRQAVIAASYAISPDGGYSDVALIDGAGREVTHADWQDWAL